LFVRSSKQQQQQQQQQQQCFKVLGHSSFVPLLQLSVADAVVAGAAAATAAAGCTDRDMILLKMQMLEGCSSCSHNSGVEQGLNHQQQQNALTVASNFEGRPLSGTAVAAEGRSSISHSNKVQ
jgi:hypothetical protein